MSDEEKFDWSDKDAVIVPATDAVAVYLNPGNDIVIRREMRWPDEQEDVFIVIPRASARRVIEVMERLLLPAPSGD